MSWFTRRKCAPPSTRNSRLVLEQLEDRVVPAVTAVFGFGVLSVVGDAANNNILVSADSNGNLQVTNNSTAVRIRVLNGQPTRDQTTLVTIFGEGGNDTLTTDKSLNTVDGNGVLVKAPSSALFGGAGNDTLTVL